MILIKNGNAYLDGGIQENIDILIEEGKIAEIGRNLSAGDAEMIEAAGKFIFPGFIDPVTKLGTFRKGDRGTTESDELTSHVTPDMHSRYAIDYTRVNEQAFYKCGITSAGVTCGDMNVISGQITAIKTFSESYSDMIVSDQVGFSGSVTDFVLRAHGHKGVLQGKEDVYACFEEALRSLLNRKHAALGQMEKLRVFVSVETAEEIGRVLRIAEEFPIDLVLVGAYQAHLCQDAICKAGASIVLGDQMYMAYNVYQGDVRKICGFAGTHIALSSTANMPRGASVLLWNMIHTVSTGVPWEKVADMVTIEPARLLGIDQRVGSLTVGKDADIVIWSDNPFVRCTAAVEAALVGGTAAYTSGLLLRDVSGTERGSM